MSIILPFASRYALCQFLFIRSAGSGEKSMDKGPNGAVALFQIVIGVGRPFSLLVIEKHISGKSIMAKEYFKIIVIYQEKSIF